MVKNKTSSRILQLLIVKMDSLLFLLRLEIHTVLTKLISDFSQCY